MTVSWSSDSKANVGDYMVSITGEITNLSSTFSDYVSFTLMVIATKCTTSSETITVTAPTPPAH